MPRGEKIPDEQNMAEVEDCVRPAAAKLNTKNKAEIVLL